MSILYPVFALVSLTLVVFLIMGRARLRALAKARIHPQRVATRRESAEVFVDVNHISDHYMNLFEMPVLFYVLALILLATGRDDGLYAFMGWLYVLVRVAHAWVHCTYNKVRHRFLAFVASAVVLWLMWARLVVQVVTA